MKFDENLNVLNLKKDNLIVKPAEYTEELNLMDSENKIVANISTENSNLFIEENKPANFHQIKNNFFKN